MRILVLGGSWYFGRLIVCDLVERGHEVSTFNRGRVADSPADSAPMMPNVQYLIGDREQEEDLRVLAEAGRWDVAVDISGKVPAVVGAAAQALAEVVDRYVCVSTIWAYRDWPDAPVAETSPLLAAHPNPGPLTRTWDPEAYGLLMAGAERACGAVFDAEHLLIVRLHVMIGPHEYADALRWWLDRSCRGGPLLLPAPDRPIQPVDVRDAARFLVDLVTQGAHGAFNLAAPNDGRTYGRLVKACAAIAAPDTPFEPVWVDEQWLANQGVQEWIEVPLWRRARSTWEVSVDRAVAAGLRCRSLEATVVDTWRWLAEDRMPRHRRSSRAYGLSPAREKTLLSRWRGGLNIPLSH